MDFNNKVNRIKELENGGNYTKYNSERQIKNTKNRIRNMKDKVTRSNVCLDSRRRKKREARIFEEIMAEIFFRIDKAHQTTDSRKLRNLKKYKLIYPPDIMVKLKNNQNKKKTLKVNSEK